MEPLQADAGELDEEEIVEALEAGRRVIITTEMLGSEHEVTLRHDGATFYCDTPTTLHKHAEMDEMRRCIREQGYARDEATDDDE